MHLLGLLATLTSACHVLDRLPPDCLNHPMEELFAKTCAAAAARPSEGGLKLERRVAHPLQHKMTYLHLRMRATVKVSH